MRTCVQSGDLLTGCSVQDFLIFLVRPRVQWRHQTSKFRTMPKESPLRYHQMLHTQTRPFFRKRQRSSPCMTSRFRTRNTLEQICRAHVSYYLHRIHPRVEFCTREHNTLSCRRKYRRKPDREFQPELHRRHASTLPCRTGSGVEAFQSEPQDPTSTFLNSMSFPCSSRQAGVGALVDVPKPW
jgi:hypothetical protein